MICYGNIKANSLPDSLRGRVIGTMRGHGAGEAPIASYQGASSKLGVIYYVRNGKQCFRGYVKPRQPDSLDQQIHARWFAEAEKHWQKIYLQHSAAWNDYAALHKRVLQYADRPMNNARHLMREVQLTRRQLGLAMSEAAPVEPPVDSRLSLFQEPAAEEDTFSFQVMHNIPDPAGMRLLVEITPAAQKPRRTPHHRSYRPICGKNARSYVELRESGAGYTVTGARFSVADGECYGLRVRVIDREYISGEPEARVFTREIRQGSLPPGSAEFRVPSPEGMQGNEDAGTSESPSPSASASTDGSAGTAANARSGTRAPPRKPSINEIMRMLDDL